MKYVLLVLLSFSFLNAKENDGPKPGSLEWLKLKQKLENAYRRESIPYFKAKHEKIAKKNLEELNREKARYETGLAKLSKGTKRYKAREQEFKAILNKIKAQKIILIYAKQYTAQLDAYDNSDTPSYNKQNTICNELRTKYTEFTGEKFPNFVEEYKAYLKNRKKKGSKKTSKRTASTK